MHGWMNGDVLTEVNRWIDCWMHWCLVGKAKEKWTNRYGFRHMDKCMDGDR